jgi:general secretion pathway protein B
MSFILDALRKSEHERQRSATPGIAQVPFGAPRREMPTWAIALIVALALAVLALGGAWLRSEWSGGAREARERAPTESPVALPPAEAPRSAPSADRALARETAARSSAQSSVRSAAASPAPALASALPAGRERAEPAATAPFEAAAEQPTARIETAPSTPAARSSEPVLPSAAALAAEGITVPRLQLQLLAYYDKPADRYVFINGTKYVEGAMLAEGPSVVSIQASGAVLSYLGHQFLLSQ